MSITRRDFLNLTLKGAVIISTGNSLECFASNGFNFPPKQHIKMRFAIVSDGHYGQAGTEYTSYHNEMLGWINEEQKARGVNFTVINGDIFHDDPAFLSQSKNIWDKLQMPYYVSHGNHDKAEETEWEKTWRIKWHHAFETEDAAFLILNTADTAGKYICPDMNWTQEQLKKYQSKNHLFVFMHITPFSWTNGGIPCPGLTALFTQQKNLSAVFHGHDHDMDNVKENGGKYYFFDSHVAGNWGTGYRGYRMVEVLKNGDILTYQMNPTAQQQVNSKNIG